MYYYLLISFHCQYVNLLSLLEEYQLNRFHADNRADNGNDSNLPCFVLNNISPAVQTYSPEKVFTSNSRISVRDVNQLASD